MESTESVARYHVARKPQNYLKQAIQIRND